MPRTISAYTDEATASRIERLSRQEQRPVSQIAGAALSLYLMLPSEAHTALRQLEAAGSPKDMERVSHEITRLLLHSQYAIAEKAVVRAMKVEGIDGMSEEDLLDAASQATRRR